jgi:hypothetical protein
MLKRADIRNKESLKRIGEFLFKIFEKRKKAIDKLKVWMKKELKEELFKVIIILCVYFAKLCI